MARCRFHIIGVSAIAAITVTGGIAVRGAGDFYLFGLECMFCLLKLCTAVFTLASLPMVGEVMLPGAGNMLQRTVEISFLGMVTLAGVDAVALLGAGCRNASIQRIVLVVSLADHIATFRSLADLPVAISIILPGAAVVVVQFGYYCRKFIATNGASIMPAAVGLASGRNILDQFAVAMPGFGEYLAASGSLADLPVA